MELDEVEVVGLQALERLVDLPPSGLLLALSGLAREKDVVADPWHPRPEPELGVAVVTRHVEVVDARVERLLDRGVRAVLVDLGE